MLTSMLISTAVFGGVNWLFGIPGRKKAKKQAEKDRQAQLVQYQENLDLNEHQSKLRADKTSAARKRAEQLGTSTSDPVADQLSKEHDDLESDILAIS